MARLLAVAAIAMFVFGSPLTAEDKKPEVKTLEGSLLCTKCKLKETPKCGHAIVVKVDKKEVTYYLDDKGGEADYHAEVCQAPKDAKVTGKVVEKDKKMWILDPKVEFKK